MDANGCFVAAHASRRSHHLIGHAVSLAFGFVTRHAQCELGLKLLLCEWLVLKRGQIALEIERSTHCSRLLGLRQSSVAFRCRSRRMATFPIFLERELHT